MIPVQVKDKAFTLPVKVTPKSSRNACIAFKPSDTAMKLTVTVPPEDGKANKAVIDLLAKLSGLPKSAISFLTGQSSRQKVLKLETVNLEETLLHLARAMGTSPDCFSTLTLNPNDAILSL